jgi:DNA-binding transcriptional LysR family regulator
VTAHIADLEANLGLQLVVRTTRQNRLTDQCRQLATRAQAMVATVEQAMAVIAADKANPVGKLRISVPFTFAADLIGPVIGQFAALYPGIRLELVVSNAVVDLIADDFDLAVRVGPLTDSSLIRRKMGSATQFLVASRTYLQKHGAPRTLDDLQHHRFVGSQPEQDITLIGPRGSVTVRVSNLIAVNDPKTIAAIVSTGCGIGVLPRFLVADQLADGSMEIVLPDYRPSDTDIAIVHYGHSANNPRIELFAAFLVATLAANTRF